MFALPVATEPQAALDAAKMRWAETGPADYRFHVQRSCFCPPPYTDRYVVRVRDGKAVRAPKVIRALSTVPKLFRLIQEQIDGDGTIEVRYGKTGLPRSIAADPIPMAADDEFGVKAGGLRDQS